VQAFKLSTSLVLIPAAIGGIIKKFIIQQLLFRWTIGRGIAKGLKPGTKNIPGSEEENLKRRFQQFDDFESFGGWKPKDAAEAAFLGRFGGLFIDSNAKSIQFSAWLLIVLILQAAFIKNIPNPVANAMVALFPNVGCHVALC